METIKYTCISFRIMDEINGPFYDFPHEIDGLSLVNENELNIWLKSIWLAEDALLNKYVDLLLYYNWKREEKLIILRNDITLNRLLEDLDINPTDDELKNILTVKEKDAYFDVLGKDSGFLKPPSGLTEEEKIPNIRANVIVDSMTGKYIGHIYSWHTASTGTLDVQGIRTSIINTINRKFGHIQYKGVSPIILDSLLKLARLLNLEVVGIIDPIGPMPDILRNLGFRQMPDDVYIMLSSTQLDVEKYNFTSFGI